jgi:5-methyltetrahydropteroyltriglutamate--homocysteine methyltransferase
MCTPRAGEMDVLAGLPDDRQIGVGLINQKHQEIESVEDVLVRARVAAGLFGTERLLLTTDCGFATFADNPIVTAEMAEAKVGMLAQVRDRLQGPYLGC